MFVIVVEDGLDLLGIAPLVIETRWPMRIARFMGAGMLDYGVADHCDFVVDDAHEESVLTAILDELLRKAAAWDILDLHQVPGSSPIITRWLEDIDRRGLSFCVDARSPSYQIDLPGTWRDYLGKLSGNTRSTLERKTRKLASEHELRFERVEDVARLPAAMDTLFALHTERWNSRGDPGIFCTNEFRHFHRDLASSLLEKGWLDLTVMLADGTPVGAIYNFAYRDTVSYYASGFEPNPEWDRYSLGKVLLGHSIRAGIDRGMAVFDLLRGDGEYKSRFAPRLATNYRLRGARKSTVHGLYARVQQCHRLAEAPRKSLDRVWILVRHMNGAGPDGIANGGGQKGLNDAMEIATNWPRSQLHSLRDRLRQALTASMTAAPKRAVKCKGIPNEAPIKNPSRTIITQATPNLNNHQSLTIWSGLPSLWAG